MRESYLKCTVLADAKPWISCALQYILLHLMGYKLSMDDLKAFRQIDSLTPGHPEAGHTDGIEVTTGPLGQGFSNAVGLAIAQAHMGATFNKDGFDLVNNYTYGELKFWLASYEFV